MNASKCTVVSKQKSVPCGNASDIMYRLILFFRSASTFTKIKYQTKAQGI